MSAPSDFDIEYSMTRDYGPPMNELAIYMTTVTALEDLCFRDQSATVPGYPHVPFRSPAIWSLPQYDMYLEISSQQVRYAIWGLQLTAGDVRKGGLWPVIARYFWRGEFTGRLDFANKKYPLPPEDESRPRSEQHSNSNLGAKASPSAMMSPPGNYSNTTAITTYLEGARLTLRPMYRGVPLSPRAVFGTAIDIMVLGAEIGPDTYCQRLERTGVEAIGEENAAGEPLLKYKSLIRAMGMLMPWMVAMDRFGEIDVEIRRDAVMIGRVKIRKRVRSAARA